MGLDGGTYITRSDVLRGQSWELNKNEGSRSTRGGAVTGVYKRAQLDPRAAKQVEWSTCRLSGTPLMPPIVADHLGNLYNKEAVLEFLLAAAGHFADQDAQHRYLNQKRTMGSDLDHLKNKRDVFDIAEPDHFNSASREPFKMENLRCPITDASCTAEPFAALSKCGHLFSQRSVDQMTDQACSICSRPFNEDYVITINGTSETRTTLKDKLEDRRILDRRKKVKRKALLGPSEEALMHNTKKALTTGEIQS